ncbi:MAG: MerR family transcriptional regulator, partial [Deltaproteobacteria bacterium]|nr:MerR family transcriptional regulator [Deltaproteobacteria bacterium]
MEKRTKFSIPDKLYYKIGEVSEITGVEPYVLRYWESEFKIVTPARTNSKHRLYRRRDLELILEIKKLLYEEKFTIAGA